MVAIATREFSISSMHIIIPARYASTRLPGKPLADVAGRPLIQRVYDCAVKSGASQVIIATDDERVPRPSKSWTSAQMKLS
jgi:3-deoxy-manno-octulosonate cytidylyltransferase (CMP-KDO synthetase)